MPGNYQAGYIKTPIGPMKSSTTKAIQQKASTLEAICAVYGMGSFFRGKTFNDLDLVAVLDCNRDELAGHAKRVHSAFRDLGHRARLSYRFDYLHTK